MEQSNILAFDFVKAEELKQVVDQVVERITQDKATIICSKRRTPLPVNTPNVVVYNRIANSPDNKVNFHLDNDQVITVSVDADNQITWSIQ